MSNQIELNTLKDVEKAFPDPESARKYLFEIRWGKFAICPFCGNERAYFIEKGIRMKCANPVCYRKFAVTGKTLFEATNLPPDKLVKILFIYSRTRGRVTELKSVIQCNIRTDFFVREKLDFAWKTIDTIGKSTADTMKMLFIACCDQYEKFKDVKRDPYYNSPFKVKDINNIGDVRQYNMLLRHTKYYLSVYAKWIWIKDFATAEDILSETFLHLSENKIKEYDADSILHYIWKTCQKMWENYLAQHPKRSEYTKTMKKKFNDAQKINIKDNYVITCIFNRKGNKMTREEIRNNKALIAEARNIIREKRNKHGRISDFQSHFN